MKKLIVILAFILLSYSLFSNGVKEHNDYIGVVLYRFDDTYISDIKDILEDASIGRIPVKIVDCQNKQSIQNDYIEEFLSDDSCKAIIVNTVDRTSSGLLIEKAKRKDIPLVFFNREPLKEDMQRWDKVYYVGADARESGIISGEIFLDYYKSHPEVDKNNDGIIQYVMIKGEAGHQDTELRTEYAINTLLNNGVRVERLYEASGYWQRSSGYDVMSDALYSFGDRIELVFANNDDMALGAIEALLENGFFQNGKYIPVIGVDATEKGRTAVEQGTLLGTVYNNSLDQAKAIYNIAYELANKRIPTSESIGYELIDDRYVWIPYTPVFKE